MGSIANCPRCTSPLGLPADIDAAAQVQCPICEVEFSLTSVLPRELPQVQLVSRAEDTIAEPTTSATADNNLSRLLRAAARPDPAAAMTPTEQAEDRAAELETSCQITIPEQAAPTAAAEEFTLGSSRLDQLLSDLMDTPAAAPTTRENSAGAEAAKEAGERFDDKAAAEPVATAFDRELPEFDDAEDEQVAWRPADDPTVAEEAPLDLRTAPCRKRRRAGFRTLIGVVGGGALGLLLGAYGLLWLLGARGDVAGLGQWLPPAMLPSSMRDPARTVGGATDSNVATNDPDDSERSIRQNRTIAPKATEVDSAVIPAAATEPTAELVNEPADAGAVADALPPKPRSATIWPTTPIVGDLQNVPFHSVAQLSEALTAADAALPQFLAGDLSRQESWSSMGPAYMALCALAERFTLTDPSTYSQDLLAAQAAAKTIFRGALGDAARRGDLSLLAGRWLEHGRRQNQGVLVVGRIAGRRAQSRWTEYVIEIPVGQTNATAVALVDHAEHSIGDEVAIVGAIISQPRDHIVGYEGLASQVIVAGYVGSPQDLAPASAETAASQP